MNRSRPTWPTAVERAMHEHADATPLAPPLTDVLARATRRRAASASHRAMLAAAVLTLITVGGGAYLLGRDHRPGRLSAAPTAAAAPPDTVDGPGTRSIVCRLDPPTVRVELDQPGGPTVLRSCMVPGGNYELRIDVLDVPGSATPSSGAIDGSCELRFTPTGVPAATTPTLIVPLPMTCPDHLDEAVTRAVVVALRLQWPSAPASSVPLASAPTASTHS